MMALPIDKEEYRMSKSIRQVRDHRLGALTAVSCRAILSGRKLTASIRQRIIPRRRDGFAGRPKIKSRPRAFVVTRIEASVADDDDDQAAAQNRQTSDDDGEEASGNAIKVTHDTPLGSKGDGADQLIKTFGILAAAAFGTDFSPRSRFAHVPRRLIVLRAGGELSNRINLMLPVQSWL
jgi:hypothetical protein